MPLGFGRSIFSKAAAAEEEAGAGGQGFTTGAIGADEEGGVSQPNFAHVRIQPNAGGTDMSDTTDISIVTWFRGLAGDMNGGSYGMLWQGVAGDMASGGARNIEIYIARDGDYKFNAFYKTDNGTRTTSKDYTDAGTLDAALLDGEWHCIMLRMSTTGANCEFVLDGTNQSSSHPSDVVGNIEISAADFEWNMSNFSGAFPGAGAAWDIGPTWMYDTAIDFTSSSVRAKYFNASNTDGYVDGGTDGTDGGATQPDLYLYDAGVAVLDGGTATPTITDVESGTASVTHNASTNGPGSGDTRTGANP